VLRAVVLTQYRCVTDGRTDRRTDRRNCYRKYSSCNASIAARCKKGLTSSPSNYRPISVTCVCCCVMERIINLELIMVALWNRADHYIFMLWFVLLLLFFISSPNLSRRTLDVCHTSTHGVTLVRISDSGMKPAVRGSLKHRTQKSHRKSPSGHHRTTLSGYIFATKARIDNRKKNW